MTPEQLAKVEEIVNEQIKRDLPVTCEEMTLEEAKASGATGLFENKYLMGAFILGAILQVVVVVIPSVAEIFKLVPLTQTQWLYTFGISILPLIIIELQKMFDKTDSKFENKGILVKRASV